MASEYLLKKYADVKPDEVRVLTPEEKRRNWWAYHKWHVVIGIVLAICLVDILLNALGVGRPKADYAVAYVGSAALSEDAEKTLIAGLEALSSDMNGDGKVVVELHQYVSLATGDSDALYYAQAAQVKLIADITQCTSYFFILENPAAFQQATNALCNIDGSLPADGDLSPEGKYVLWADCPALAALPLSEDFGALAFARRGFWTEKKTPNAPQCDELWHTLTQK